MFVELNPNVMTVKLEAKMKKDDEEEEGHIENAFQALGFDA